MNNHIKLNFLSIYLIFSFGSVKTLAIGPTNEKNHFPIEEGRNTIQLKHDASSFLYCTEALTVEGNLKIVGGNNMECKGNFELVWDINVPTNGVYELYLIANVREKGKNAEVLFKTIGGNSTFKLNPTEGPYQGGRNFQRIKLTSDISLIKGPQTVSFSTHKISHEDILLDFRSIELVPTLAKKKIEKEMQRA